MELLRPLLERYLASVGFDGHVGSDQFIYWRQYAPTDSVSPDIYVLPGESQRMAIGSWKVWETEVVPCFALEVVTSGYRKDYEHSPRRYSELGVDELVIFDPFPRPGGNIFQLFRKSPLGLRLVEASSEDRVYSQALGCFLRLLR